MTNVRIVFDVVTYEIRRIEIDASSKLAADERVKTISSAVYKQLGSHDEVAKALGLR